MDAAEEQLGKTTFLRECLQCSRCDADPSMGLVEQVKQAGVELSSCPQLNAWWKRVKKRPSFKNVFGPAISPLTVLTLVLPTVFKVML